MYFSQTLLLASNAGGWVGNVAHMEQKKNACVVLVRVTEGKRPLGKHGLEWEGNINMDLREISWEGIIWINVFPNTDKWWAFVNTRMNFRIPHNVGIYMSVYRNNGVLKQQRWSIRLI